MANTSGDLAAFLASQAAKALNEIAGVDKHHVAVVLGSGWAPAAERLGIGKVETSVAELPGFAPPSVGGHVGTIRSLRVGEQNVLVFLGRTHLYEGHGVAPVAHGVRVAAAAGCDTVVLTNAAGGLREGLTVGQPVLISDHLNFTGRSPINGASFVDLTHAYSPELRALAQQIDPTLVEGVYAAMPGPHYETPAEIRALRVLGADLVGMSTVLETIAAREAGMRVLGISLVTNLAAGMIGRPLDHAEVLAAGQAAALTMGDLLTKVIAQLP